jgi:3-methyladenine DNA glycosylase AlkD
MPTSAAAKSVMKEPGALEDPRMRAVDETRGDDHGVNLTQLRAIAKRLKTQHEPAIELWATVDTSARLLATLIAKPPRASISPPFWTRSKRR